MIDIDGNEYKTIKIGNQWWMAENLKVAHYRDGSEISRVEDKNEWSNLTSGAYCDYANDSNNAVAYGHLYNWYAVNHSSKLAPAGWHIPSNDEWLHLERVLGLIERREDQRTGPVSNEGGMLKEAGFEHWLIPNEGANNLSGFTALPGGYRDDYLGDYMGVGSVGHFWSSSASSSDEAYSQELNWYSGNVPIYLDYNMQSGCSVRCVRDN
jgi:uncharacterized protein (TIGR02145 family)